MYFFVPIVYAYIRDLGPIIRLRVCVSLCTVCSHYTCVGVDLKKLLTLAMNKQHDKRAAYHPDGSLVLSPITSSSSPNVPDNLDPPAREFSGGGVSAAGHEFAPSSPTNRKFLGKRRDETAHKATLSGDLDMSGLPTDVLDVLASSPPAAKSLESLHLQF